jgi:hypothetical protein
MAGENAVFTVTLRDNNENPTGTSENSNVAVSGKKGIQCSDIGFGVFECSYNFQKANTYQITVQVNGQSVLSVEPYTYDLVIRPREIDPSSGKTYSFSHTFLWDEVKRNTQKLVTFESRDEYNNPARGDSSIEMVCNAMGPRDLNAKLNTQVVHLDMQQSDQYAGTYKLDMGIPR